MNLYRPSAAIARVTAASLRPTGAAAPAGAVSLSMGEPDFETPSEIIDAAVEALHEGWTHYGNLNGDPELRQCIADLVSTESGRSVGPEEVLVSHGGAAAITATILATVNPGEKVVIPEPTYSLYPDAVRLAGGEPVFVPTRSDNQLDVPALVAAARGARLIALCNPVNPTGAVFTPESLEQLAEGLQGTDTLVLADEAYSHMVYDEGFISSLAIPALQERLVYCQTLSKTFAMTGWRIGYVVAPDGIIESIRAVHRTMNSAVNATVQRASLKALQLGPGISSAMLAAYRERRDYVVERLKNIPGVEFTEPTGAFYAFFSYPQALPATVMLDRFKDHGVILRAGSEYGPSGEGHLRLSFAADLDTLETALDRIEQGILEIQG
ncbi:aminotransferase class I/II-fold pyridoxal phosphate-dependent enzyme [Arthrobacter sp. EpRS71]|uniref:pyridoxal phosphate-dependent aminotransferase n=1 Tax=Arthrobacter sp. EpRS71 TaxID=1743141 RepID=UPI000748DE76|nr:aminotransferase class I/II-fold pyridoxal phosphate-dependent enzyme [Arthrobacter sp. EpRS71]KUM36351.1 aspartate aminotransferase [Arthrobacter sp. EpRS71]